MILSDNHGLLIKPINANLENIELRATLEKAVEDANLNVTERAALNHEFFPHGDGFNLFPKNTDTAEFTIFLKDKNNDFNDSFSKELEEINKPSYIKNTDTIFIRSEGNNFKRNLENALKKLNNYFKNQD